MDSDLAYMAIALEEANAAAARDEVPIGAVIVDPKSGKIIARAGNQTRALCDPSAHAEIMVIRKACETLGSERIPGLYLYVTLEPCTMCAGAISFARLARVCIGAQDAKGGGIYHGAQFYNQPTCHHKPELVSGVMQEECGQILRDFFKRKRSEKS